MSARDPAIRLNEAAQSFARGELGRAEAICRRLLLEYPQSVDVLHLLGLVKKGQGDTAEAERLLRECVRLDPERAEIRANLGNLLNGAGRFAEAESSYREALEREPQMRSARLGLARTFLRSGKNAEALREARTLADGNAADAEAWTIAGTALRSLSEPEQAESALRRALRIDPRRPVARHNLGALLNQLSRSEEALAELAKAEQAGVRGAEIDFNTAGALIALHRFDEAEARLTRSIAAAPRDPRTHRLLARLRFMRGAGDFGAAIGKAVSDFPEDVPLRITYSQLLRGAGSLDAATEALLAAPNPANPRLKAELAAVYQDAGQFDAACKAAREATAADPEDTGFRDVLLDTLLALGRADEAMPLIEAARAGQPSNQWYIAMEATAARVLEDPRYESWYDYDRLVRVFELEPPPGWSSIESFHADLVPVLNDRHRFHAHPLDQSLRNGTQTPRGLLGDPAPHIQAFIDSLNAPLRAYRESAGFDPEHVFRARNRGEHRLIGCWSVRLGPGGFHLNHVHPEGWISSAYYLQVPPEVQDPARKSGWLKFGEPRFPVPGTGAGHFVQPKPGRLVLFPSYMWHGTTPILGNQPRLAIAFDVVAAP